MNINVGDALPASIQIFARALNVSEAQLFKLMETGKLFSADVLPKVSAEFKKAALEGGAYELALQGLRVTEGRMVNESQRAGNKIFKSGFAKGLADLYDTLAKTLKTSGPELTKLGKAFGMVFSGLARGIERVTPLLKMFIDKFEFIMGSVALLKIGRMALAWKSFGLAAASSMAVALAPITAVLAGLASIEDFLANFDSKKISLLEAAQGYQVVGGRRIGVKERDGQFFAGEDRGAASFSENLARGRFSTENDDTSKLLNKLNMGFSETFLSNRNNATTQPSQVFTKQGTSGAGTSNNIKVDINVKGVQDSNLVSNIKEAVDEAMGGMFNGAHVPQSN